MDVRTFATISIDPAAFQAELIIPSVHGPRRFGDVMADFQRERFASINPALVAIANGDKPPIGRHWWEATKGGSKDSDLAVALLWLLAFTRRPLSCQVGAADADQADELRKAAKDILRLNAWLAEAIDVQSWQIVGKRTDSACEIIAADVAGSHGARPSVLILNELSHVRKREFAENLLDNAAKVPNGLAIVATNAGFLDTWQFEWRELARTSPRWSFQRLAEPSPWLNPADMEEAKRRNSPNRFRRLWEGEWSLDTGNAIPLDQIERAKRLRGPHPCRLSERHVYIAGVDLATRRDRSAVVVLAFDELDPRHQVDLAWCQAWSPSDFPNRTIPLAVVRDAILRIHERFYLERVIADPYGAQLLVEELVQAGISCTLLPFTGPNLDLMAKSLLEAFSDDRVQLYDDPALLRDLGRLQLVERPQGWKLKAVADETGHADLAVAATIALPFALGWAKEIREESYDRLLPDNVLKQLRGQAEGGAGLRTTYVI